MNQIQVRGGHVSTLLFSFGDKNLWTIFYSKKSLVARAFVINFEINFKILFTLAIFRNEFFWDLYTYCHTAKWGEKQGEGDFVCHCGGYPPPCCPPPGAALPPSLLDTTSLTLLPMPSSLLSLLSLPREDETALKSIPPKAVNVAKVPQD